MPIKPITASFLLKSSAIVTVGSIAASILQYLFTVVMARLLSPDSFGSLASLLSWITILIFPAGVISVHVTRQTAIYLAHDEKTRLLKLYRRHSLLSLAGIAFFIIILLTADLLNLFPAAWPFSYFLLTVIIIGFSLLSAVNQGLLHGSQYFARLSLLAFISAFFKFFLSGILVANGYDVFGVAVALSASGTITYLISLWLVRRVLRSASSMPSSPITTIPPSNTRYMPYIFSALFLLMLLSNIDIILAKQWLEADAAGYYAILATAGKVIFFGTVAISGVAFPSATQASATGSGQEKHILAISLSTVLALAACAVSLYLFFPQQIITIVFGTDYLPAAPHLGHIGIIAGLWAIIQLYVRLLLAKGDRLFLIPLAIFIAAEVAGISIWHQSISAILLVLFITGSLLALSLALIYQYSIAKNDIAKNYH